MLTYRCIDKIKNNNKITAYRLIGENGTIVIESGLLKDKIRNGSIQITNLRLTNDNRLLDVIYNRAVLDKFKIWNLMSNAIDSYSITFKSNLRIDVINQYKNKSKLLGIEYGSIQDNVYYIKHNGSLIIFSNIQISFPIDSSSFFMGVKQSVIDIKEVDTYLMRNINSMFGGCRNNV